MGSYAEQDRGDAGAYARYLAGLDASVRQKVALTAAHLMTEGRVADIGMGSGTGSDALAALYPRLSVVGVDVNPEMVERARAAYRRPNLAFAVGDAAAAVFPPESLDGIFNSSVLHHVTTFGDYRYENAAEALAVQARALKSHGVLIVRDFVDPGGGEVWMDLPTADGDDSQDPSRCSTASLFERFAREFRSLSPSPGFSFRRLGADDPGAPLVREGWRRYQLSHKLAAEFALRKDYRTDWVSEVKEEYTYFTQARFEAIFADLSLRVLASVPLRNPWIVRNRFRGKLELRTLDGGELELPPTHYLIAGERVPPGEGLRFREGPPAPPLGFLEMSYFRHRVTGEGRDLVRRPNTTVDVLPYFEHEGALYALARMSYPRPLPSCKLEGGAAIDGSAPASYLTEPLSALQQDKPLGQTVEELLEARAGIAPSSLRRFREGAAYYPSPGGVQEEVRSALVEIDPVFVTGGAGNLTGLSTPGRVRAIECQQVLRCAQVGGLPEARLELNTYELLLQLGRAVGPWIGEALDVRTAGAPRVDSLPALCARPGRRVFERAGTSVNFLELRCASFEELNAKAEVVVHKLLEYVVPRRWSATTVAAAVLRRHGGELFLGVDDDDLPAAQSFRGNSQLLVAPAWRLPRDTSTLSRAWEFLRGRLSAEHGLTCGELWELGGRYYPSPGVTPEVVHPVAIEVLAESGAGRPLHWVPLREVATERASLLDGHLRIVALRAAHATGLLRSFPA